MKSIKSKLILNSYQELVLKTLSNEHRLLYNYLLNCAKQNSNFKYLNQQYKQFRKENNLTIQSKPAQNTCRKLINAIKSYYKLKKKDPTAKFPNKFKSWRYFTTIEFDWNNGGGGFDLENNKIFIHLEHDKRNAKKLELELHERCKVVNSSNVKTLQIKKIDDNYYAIFTYSEPKKELKLSGVNIAIDPGVINIATIFNPQKNEIIEIKNNQFHKKLEKRIEKVQSLLDHKKKKSRRWKKLKRVCKRTKRKLTNKNRDFQHKVSKEIINYCQENNINKIIYGDIQTKKLVKKKIKGQNRKERKRNSGLNKSTQNQGCLSRFKFFVGYKAEDKGIEFVKQDEAWTSQTNCLTGKRFGKKVQLSDRVVELAKDLKFSRDGNGSVNIMQKNLKCPIEPNKGLWLTQLKSVKTFEMLLDHDEWSKSELKLNNVQLF
jgi:putative transposase